MDNTELSCIFGGNYYSGVDFGDGRSCSVFVVFKDNKVVWQTKKMWLAKLYTSSGRYLQRVIELF